jgi:hypothetical protein
MAQRLSQKVVNTFIKGLVTEAGELTFPEDASIDESNCLLDRDGSRRRRLAAKLETSNVNSTFTINNTFVFTTGRWKNAAGVAGLDFVVIQDGTTLRFYNTASEPYSGNQESFSVNLNSFDFAGSVGPGLAKVQMATANGNLVVTSEAIEPFYVTYDPDTNTISTAQISPRVRDFEWLGDTTTYSTSLADPDLNRQYDTANSGWSGEKGEAALADYLAYDGDGDTVADDKYPALTHPWYSGKNADGNFSADEWTKVFTGSTLTGNGSFILDFFSKDRSTASGIAGITTEIENSRFKAVASFSGRIFYAGLTSSKNAGKILFSKYLDNITEASRCYQQNDPTSEEFSDLLDTDGGVISIPEASNILKLHTFGSSIFVFAENGVWQITGVDGVFKATEYSISRVSQIGLNNPQSFVSVEGVPLWWSKHGIHTLNFDQVSGRAQEQNLSIGTIQSFFEAIDGNARQKCTAVYDQTNKRVHWFYPNNGELINNKKNKVLTLDITLQAFYPWTVSDSATNPDYILGAEYYPGFGSNFVENDVITLDGDDVLTSAGDDVVVTSLTELSQADAAIVLMVYDGDTGKMTMGLFSGTDFLDWGDANYSSYAEAGYDFMGDLILKKNAPYIQVYLRSTETGFSGSDELGYTPVRESSLLISAYWDFRTNTSTSPQQAYRLKYTPVVNESSLGTWDYPEKVVTTRLKMRGHGRNMRLRFESEQGKDFVLLGFGILNAVNTRY